MKETQRVFTENAENEQWQMILQYAYSTNIRAYLSNRKGSNITEDLIESIGGSISQAYEYFIASKSATINISPLLLYYGVSNLLYGFGCLHSAKKLDINGHGMYLKPDTIGTKRIADTEFIAQNLKRGALLNYQNIIHGENIGQNSSWNLLEIFGSIPDLWDDFDICYPTDIPYVIPIQVINRRKDNVEVVSGDKLKKYTNIDKVLQDIEGFSKCYLTPQWPQNNNMLVLRKRLGGKDIGIYAISGNKYLPVGHRKKNQVITLDLIILIFMGLYVLSTLSRYYPHIWNPFVKNDTTGERLFIEKFIAISKRYIPNLLLNKLYDKRFIFVNEQQGIINEVEEQDREELKSLIQEELKRHRGASNVNS